MMRGNEEARTSYAVKEIFFTLQGEGAHSGRPAVFCRFAGCNLWSGREQDRATAQCRFCDTDFVGTDGPGGGVFKDPEALSAYCRASWKGEDKNLFIVLTGGEPMLQINTPLLEALHRVGFQIAIETNGTLPVLDAVDWICVSPKAGTELRQRAGDELKLVFPQKGIDPEDLTDLAFSHFFLQPMHSAELEENTIAAIDYCLAHPQWRLSLQIHKELGIA